MFPRIASPRLLALAGTVVLWASAFPGHPGRYRGAGGGRAVVSAVEQHLIGGHAGGPAQGDHRQIMSARQTYLCERRHQQQRESRDPEQRACGAAGFVPDIRARSSAPC
ncbi:hypothetical protein SSPO_076570 [Streptomyces antimycoticus]|uniref:Uncharacterized protein n=1 Tax=Streptomyces antimycoticus TaxID=68175 RepID=A0A499V7I2_9ACTN|nr:hypothetical protein [Streptomyces antimycoticus]BBJ44939.1 hypothetical protein SSPO_076570 [Streptomyces antimycoticus]